MDKLKLERLNKIAVLGPHDRINFGDFLFPIMLDFALSKTFNSKIELKKFSLVKADFSHLGAFSSNSYKVLTKSINNNEIDTVIVAGGECINVTWDALFRFISPVYNLIRKKNNKLSRLLNRTSIAKKILGGKSEYPYCINKNDFEKKFILIYNSVGGFQSFTKNHLHNFELADYISVRDKITFHNTQELKTKKAFLVPDSACIISDCFPNNDKTKLSLLRKQIKNINKDFIFFQVSNIYHDNKIKEIANQLNKISKEKQLKIILCPIGTAAGHEDHIALEKISHHLLCDFLLISTPTIHEIIHLISNSSFYIGSSLHGIITCMSYGVPYIGLNKRQTKIKSYLDSWSIDKLNNLVDLDDFYILFKSLFDLNIKNEILEKNKIQKELYYDSIKRIIKIINNN